MQVSVDRELCTLNAICMGIAPGVFEIGSDDQLHILTAEVSSETARADVLDAVATCPNRALHAEP